MCIYGHACFVSWSEETIKRLNILNNTLLVEIGRLNMRSVPYLEHPMRLKYKECRYSGHEKKDKINCNTNTAALCLPNIAPAECAKEPEAIYIYIYHNSWLASEGESACIELK